MTQSTPPGGKRETLYGKTRKEVQEELAAALGDVRQGLPLPDRRMTVGQFLDTWLAEVVKPRLRWTTYHSYEQSVRNHLKPSLGNTRLAQLAAPQIQAFLNDKLDEGCLRDRSSTSMTSCAGRSTGPWIGT